MSFEVSQAGLVDRAASQRALGLAVELPADYTEYVLSVHGLVPAEFFSWCQTTVLERRAGAYEFIDIVLFLWAFFSSATPETSLADFAKMSAQYGPELAGVAGRKRWMSQASVSRGLCAVGQVAAQEAAAKLLHLTSASSRTDPLASTAGYRDGLGEAWLVLHWDTTVTAMRGRALPEDEDLPEPRRLTTDFAAPGYPGRKRGEVQVSRSVIQDATTATWVHVDLAPGNGRLAEQLDAAAVAARQYLGDDAAQLARTVVVADGVAGGLVQARRLYAHGLHFLTRWSRYDVLESGELAESLSTGPWFAVTDSKSGPRREAMEFGQMRFDDMGSCRVIVTRFRAKPGRQRGAGHSINGWRYELFITTMPAERWAAEDLVTLYYGRTAIENRFAAEDREFNLHRVFCYSAAGQLLSYAVAMALWNLRCVGGLAAVADEKLPQRPLRSRPTPPESPESAAPASIASEQLEPSEVSVTPQDEAHQKAEAEKKAAAAAAASAQLAAVERAREPWCAANPSWSVDDNSTGLRCPAGNLIPLSGLRLSENGASTIARYRAPRGLCGPCSERSSCSPSAKAERFQRELTMIVPAAAPTPAGANKTLAPAPVRHHIAPSQPVSAPQYLPEAPVILPAVLRKKTCKLIKLAAVSVIAPEPEELEDQPEHLCDDDAERQRRRLTIQERVALNQRDDLDAVAISVRGDAPFVNWFQNMNTAPRSA